MAGLDHALFFEARFHFGWKSRSCLGACVAAFVVLETSSVCKACEAVAAFGHLCSPNVKRSPLLMFGLNDVTCEVAVVFGHLCSPQIPVVVAARLGSANVTVSFRRPCSPNAKLSSSLLSDLSSLLGVRALWSTCS